MTHDALAPASGLQEMFFRDPHQLLAVYQELEESNLFYIQVGSRVMVVYVAQVLVDQATNAHGC